MHSFYVTAFIFCDRTPRLRFDCVAGEARAGLLGVHVVPSGLTITLHPGPRARALVITHIVDVWIGELRSLITRRHDGVMH